ncbi:hypothetical protein T265_12167 [Opisthorchis viverrini]|uniref:Uncharacterized protein n=1 Tax=Opisthorchis viverrini TaxID=6198 RepID=A0A074ZU84_OPIVI|nr:hypothetical protein T265_12167 [Opisthorchis viverrini]KER18759.1 hypothetical protein T265_12167 [Opisthorchis viverrini]
MDSNIPLAMEFSVRSPPYDTRIYSTGVSNSADQECPKAELSIIVTCENLLDRKSLTLAIRTRDERDHKILKQ